MCLLACVGSDMVYLLVLFAVRVCAVAVILRYIWTNASCHDIDVHC